MSLEDGEPENLARMSRKAQLELSQGFVALNEYERSEYEFRRRRAREYGKRTLRQTNLELANKPHKNNLKTRIKPRTI